MISKKELRTNLEKFELDWEVLEPLFIGEETQLRDFDIEEGDIIIRIRKAKKKKKKK